MRKPIERHKTASIMELHDMVNNLTSVQSEIADKLLRWIKSFSWVENEEQTDAVMRFSVAGISDWHLDAIVDINAINGHVVEQMVAVKAAQFIDVYKIDDITWTIDSMDDARGRHAEVLHVYAYLRLSDGY